jgi:lipoate-protein ligase A
VNSDLQALKECLKWEETYPEDQRDFVKSKRSQVANLSEYMPSITLDTVKNAVICEFVHTLAPKDVIFLG